MNINSGNRRKRGTKKVVQTLPFNLNAKKHLHQEKESGTKSSDIKANKTQLLPFTTCIRTLPFLKSVYRKNLFSLVFDSLKSIHLGSLAPSDMLQYYQNHCTCAVD